MNFILNCRRKIRLEWLLQMLLQLLSLPLWLLVPALICWLSPCAGAMLGALLSSLLTLSVLILERMMWYKDNDSTEKLGLTIKLFLKYLWKWDIVTKTEIIFNLLYWKCYYKTISTCYIAHCKLQLALLIWWLSRWLSEKALFGKFKSNSTLFSRRKAYYKYI